MQSRTPFRKSRLVLWMLSATLACGGLPGEPAEGEDLTSADDAVGSSENALTGTVVVGATLKTTTGLNLRTGAGTQNAVIVVMPGGASVTALRADPVNGWYNVRYGTRTGWASGAYLVATAAPPPPPPAGSVSIYQGPVVAHAQAFANDACATVGCPFVLQTRPGHSPTQRQAIDFMQSTGGRLPSDAGARGDRLASFGLERYSVNRMQYLIWRQRINSNDGRGWRAMADRGSITANHHDHVHVSFNP